MWSRVADRARVRSLTSINDTSEDARLTRTIVASVLEDSRDESDVMSDEEAERLVRELEEELEQFERYEQTSHQAPSSSPETTQLSEYEQQRLKNIARNRQVLQELGLEETHLAPPERRHVRNAEREQWPPPRNSGNPSRRSARIIDRRQYYESEHSEEEAEEGD